ncbi:MAG TPA: aldolase/citrate lyase family protein, partial [Nocardioides sp.]|nr:aldolase/citrate lyase family protein [Nocardioides sp.]
MTARSALYVPGDRPDRFDKAVASGADVIVLDLEDAVGPDRKDTAREAVCAWLAGSGRGLDGTQVRVNPPTGELGRADLAALPTGVAVRVPKVESPDALDAVGRGRPLHALLESALGVER